MHGYDSYAFGHRDFYAAINRFTTIDWKAEDTYDVSPYSYAGNNPVRYRDENGDGLWDVVNGATDAFVDDAVPTSNLSGTSQPDNEVHYLIGQVIGHLGAALTGGSEMISGGGTAAGGATVALVTAPTVVGAAAGAGVAVAGAAVATHGAMMTLNATKNMAGMRQKFENATNKQSTQKKENQSKTNKNSKSSADSEYSKSAEHTKKTPSKEEKHEMGQKRKNRDQGGEKGDARRKRYK